MYDQALIWNTDEKLHVTTLTARLRDHAGIGKSISGPIRVSDLWGEEDPFGVAVVAHHWALDGESLSFETTIRGVAYIFELEPLHDCAGNISGVAGRALEARHTLSHVRTDVLREAEHVAGIGTWHEDLRTGLVTVSDGLASLLGIPQHGKALDIRSFDHPDDRSAIAATVLTQSNDCGYRSDHRIVCSNGRIRSVRERVRTIFDDRGVAISRIGTLTDISDLKEREAELAELAHYDRLTGLPNRILLDERLSASLVDAQRDERHCAVLFIDLDDFKTVNDTFGHVFGDRLLACVGERLSRYIRATDTVARVGGDEFVVVIEGLYGDEAASDAAHKILQSFYDPFSLDAHVVAVSASIGVATYPTAARTASELIAAADREMYVVKRNGGRGVKIAVAAEREARMVAASEKNLACRLPSSMATRLYATPQSV